MTNISNDEYKELYGKKYYWDLLVRAYSSEKNANKEIDTDLVMEMARLLRQDERDQAYAKSVMEAFIPKETKYELL